MTIPVTLRNVEGFGPDRLWSLWDMLKFNASAFHEVLNSMAGTRSWIEERKKEEGWYSDGSYGPAIQGGHDIGLLVSRAQELKPLLEQLNARVTLEEVNRHIKELE